MCVMILSLATMPGVKGKSGGKRIGVKAPANRPLKYNEPTTVIRVPLSLVPKIEAMLKKIQAKKKK